jgi:hypothetical protein
VLATQPILSKPLAWAGHGVMAVKQASDQSLQFLADGLAWASGFILAVWTWSSDQIVRMTQTPWETWPLWKQLVLIIVAGFAVYVLFLAARQLWWAALNVLSALAGFIATLIVTLPAILLAGAVALAGLWLINNFHDLSSLRSIISFPGHDGSPGGNGATPPGQGARPGPADTIEGR